MEAKRMKIVCAVCERSGRPCLNRIGVAFVDADSVLDVKLEALPVSAELRIVHDAPSGEAPRASLPCPPRHEASAPRA